MTSPYRPLHVTLAELAEGVLESAARTAADLPLRSTSVELSLPIELRLPAGEGDLRGDLPLFRRRTAFDAEPARLTMKLAEVPA